jgi:hypothetical protein
VPTPPSNDCTPWARDDDKAGAQAGTTAHHPLDRYKQQQQQQQQKKKGGRSKRTFPTFPSSDRVRRITPTTPTPTPTRWIATASFGIPKCTGRSTCIPIQERKTTRDRSCPTRRGTQGAAKASSSQPHWPWIQYDTSLGEAEPGRTVRRGRGFGIRSVQHRALGARGHDPPPQLRAHVRSRSGPLVCYVPDMLSLEAASTSRNNTVPSPYEQTLLDAILHRTCAKWESTQWFECTSKCWKRRNGSDHVGVVYSEPLHGWVHVTRQRGSATSPCTHTQQQFATADRRQRAWIGPERLSKCILGAARRNELLPDPNTDGKCFSGAYERQTMDLLNSRSRSSSSRGGSATASPISV